MCEFRKAFLRNVTEGINSNTFQKEVFPINFPLKVKQVSHNSYLCITPRDDEIFFQNKDIVFIHPTMDWDREWDFYQRNSLKGDWTIHLMNFEFGHKVLDWTFPFILKEMYVSVFEDVHRFLFSMVFGGDVLNDDFTVEQREMFFNAVMDITIMLLSQQFEFFTSDDDYPILKEVGETIAMTAYELLTTLRCIPSRVNWVSDEESEKQFSNWKERTPCGKIS